MQKLLINTVEEKDYYVQETCHLLLQLPMIKASCDFVILSLDGCHAVEDHLEEGQCAIALSIVGHYVGRPVHIITFRGWTNDQTIISDFDWSLLHFVTP